MVMVLRPRKNVNRIPPPQVARRKKTVKVEVQYTRHTLGDLQFLSVLMVNARNGVLASVTGTPAIVKSWGILAVEMTRLIMDAGEDRQHVEDAIKQLNKLLRFAKNVASVYGCGTVVDRTYARQLGVVFASITRFKNTNSDSSLESVRRALRFNDVHKIFINLARTVEDVHTFPDALADRLAVRMSDRARRHPGGGGGGPGFGPGHGPGGPGRGHGPGQGSGGSGASSSGDDQSNDGGSGSGAGENEDKDDSDRFDQDGSHHNQSNDGGSGSGAGENEDKDDSDRFDQDGSPHSNYGAQEPPEDFDAGTEMTNDEVEDLQRRRVQFETEDIFRGEDELPTNDRSPPRNIARELDGHRLAENEAWLEGARQLTRRSAPSVRQHRNGIESRRRRRTPDLFPSSDEDERRERKRRRVEKKMRRKGKAEEEHMTVGEERMEPDFAGAEVDHDNNENGEGDLGEERMEPDFAGAEVDHDNNENGEGDLGEERMEPDFAGAEVDHDNNENGEGDLGEERMEPDFAGAEVDHDNNENGEGDLNPERRNFDDLQEDDWNMWPEDMSDYFAHASVSFVNSGFDVAPPNASSVISTEDRTLEAPVSFVNSGFDVAPPNASFAISTEDQTLEDEDLVEIGILERLLDEVANGENKERVEEAVGHVETQGAEIAGAEREADEQAEEPAAIENRICYAPQASSMAVVHPFNAQNVGSEVAEGGVFSEEQAFGARRSEERRGLERETEGERASGVEYVPDEEPMDCSSPGNIDRYRSSQTSDSSGDAPTSTLASLDLWGYRREEAKSSSSSSEEDEEARQLDAMRREDQMHQLFLSDDSEGGEEQNQESAPARDVDEEGDADANTSSTSTVNSWFGWLFGRKK